jgi:hypothetical protein
MNLPQEALPATAASESKPAAACVLPRPLQAAERTHRRAEGAVCIGLMTLIALLVHGYHFGLEDQDVYVTAIKKLVAPGLYPHNAQFFILPMRTMGTQFDRIFAFFVHYAGLSVASSVFLGYLLSNVLIFLGLWQIAQLCLPSAAARWSAMLMVASLLTLPVAGTALYLVDQYLHPRALATAGLLLAIAAALQKRWLRMALCLVFAFLMHPLMTVFGVSFLFFLCVRVPRRLGTFAGVALPFLSPLPPAWYHAVRVRTFYFLWQWKWYELLGAAGPFVLLWFYHRLAKQRGLPLLARLCSRLIAFGLFQFALALALTLPPPLLRLACYEPMRWLHLFYLIFVFITGALIGEYLLRRSAWRWLVLFLPIAGGMFLAQRALFPNSSHLELGLGDASRSRNEWVRAYDWIRRNTPTDAYFVMSPRYMREPGQEYHGFRVLAERSMLADDGKDAGEAAVFPQLLPTWEEQVRPRRRWRYFMKSDLQGLSRSFGVDWAIVTENAKHPLSPELAGSCRYRSPHLCVLRIMD